MKSSRMPPMTSPKRASRRSSGDACDPGPESPAPRLLPLGPFALEEEAEIPGLGRARAEEEAPPKAEEEDLLTLPSPKGGIVDKTFSASPGQ